MKKLNFVLPLIALAGCATSPTPSTFLERAPDAIYMSEKKPEIVTECIVSKWENTRVIGARYIANHRATPTGFRITFGPAERLVYMADVERIAAGTKTRLFVDGMVISFGQNPTVADAAQCH